MKAPNNAIPNTLTIDFAGNPALRQLLGAKQIGDDCTLEIDLQCISKTADDITFTIKKVKTDDYEGEDAEDEASEPTGDQPIMMQMRRKKSQTPMGPNNRPPQTAQNQTEPGLTAYV